MQHSCQLIDRKSAGRHRSFITTHVLVIQAYDDEAGPQGRVPEAANR